MKTVQWAMLALLPCIAWPAVAQTEPLNIGDRRELFVDRLLVDEMDGASLTMHHPDPAPPAEKPLKDTGQYGGTYIYGTVLQDGDIFRFYGRRDLKDYPQVIVYAESTDGINWVEPDLGLFEVPGVPAGNVIMDGEVNTVHNFTPFLDTRPGVPAEQRYKGVGGTKAKEGKPETRPGGLRGYVSADGVHWKRIRDEPIIPNDWGWFDSQNLVFWSPLEERYVCYFRVFDNRYAPGVRSIKRTTSIDFLNWTNPVDVKFNLPRPGGPNRYSHKYEQLYINNIKPYFRAPHIYIGLPTRINFDRNAPSEIILTTSRDGVNFTRTFDSVFHRPGAAGTYGNRGHYFCHQMIQTAPGELSFYSYQPRRYTLRLDGFTSLHAPFEGGQMTTKPMTFTGDRLEINAKTGAMGYVKIEIQDEQRRPIRGFTLQDAVPAIGDDVAHTVTWNRGPDVSSLAGRPLRLRFVMKDADVYSLKFNDEQ